MGCLPAATHSPPLQNPPLSTRSLEQNGTARLENMIGLHTTPGTGHNNRGGQGLRPAS